MNKNLFEMLFKFPEEVIGRLQENGFYLTTRSKLELVKSIKLRVENKKKLQAVEDACGA